MSDSEAKDVHIWTARKYFDKRGKQTKLKGETK